MNEGVPVSSFLPSLCRIQLAEHEAEISDLESKLGRVSSRLPVHCFHCVHTLYMYIHSWPAQLMRPGIG